MTTSDSTFKKSELLTMALLALVAMALVTVVVVPALRTKVKDVFVTPDREVLAKVSGKISTEGPQVTVLKIKNQNALSVEVFAAEEGGALALIAKIPLFEVRDGHFLLKGNATNLALMDVDNDGHLEIVAPTYDDQLVPRLNVFRYNVNSKSFDRVSAPEGFEP